MELIQPAEISGKIMTIIDQAKEQLILVSPYNNIGSWKKLIYRIEKALDRGVKIIWYIRKGEGNGFNDIKKFGIHPIVIENLHTKLYMNEKHAIVTSMNLHLYSDNSSIDIGYYINDAKRHEELLEYIDIHLSSTTKKSYYVAEPENKIKPVRIEHERIVSTDNINNKFVDLVIDYLEKYKSYYKEISLYNNGFGTVICLLDFLDHYELILDPKRSGYRINLKIRVHHKIRSAYYEILKTKKSTMENQCGEEVDFGGHVKWLKIDLNVFENYDFESWCNNEFDLLKPKLDSIIEMYIKELNITI